MAACVRWVLEAAPVERASLAQRVLTALIQATLAPTVKLAAAAEPAATAAREALADSAVG